MNQTGSIIEVIVMFDTIKTRVNTVVGRARETASNAVLAAKDFASTPEGKLAGVATLGLLVGEVLVEAVEYVTDSI